MARALAKRGHEVTLVHDADADAARRSTSAI
jgi:NADPH-dependent 2,4-dienoyl-CoA reductase/sulfur reductase-like enzyme